MFHIFILISFIIFHIDYRFSFIRCLNPTRSDRVIFAQYFFRTLFSLENSSAQCSIMKHVFFHHTFTLNLCSFYSVLTFKQRVESNRAIFSVLFKKIQIIIVLSTLNPSPGLEINYYVQKIGGLRSQRN